MREGKGRVREENENREWDEEMRKGKERVSEEREGK